MTETDSVDRIVAEWARERRDVNTEGVQVIGRVLRLSRYFERRMEPTFTSRGLNGAAFYLLAALRRSGPPYRKSPTELYSSLLVSSGAITNRIDRLESRGLVTRVPDAVDGRSMLVALTSKGRALVDRIVERHANNEVKLLSALTEHERAVLVRLLRKLLLSFGDLAGTVDTEPGGEIGRSRGVRSTHLVLQARRVASGR